MRSSMRSLALSLIVFSLCIVSEGKVKQGDQFIPFVLPILKSARVPNNSNKSISMDKFKGKVVLVDFWASWCGPCKSAMPAYDELYKKYKTKGFAVVGINVDDEMNSGAGFLSEFPVSFPVAYDQGKKFIEKVGVSTMPTSFLIDRKGKIKVVHQGFHEGDSKTMDRNIASLLKK